MFNNEKFFMERYYKLKEFKGEPIDDIVSFEASEEFRNKLIKLLLEELR